MHTTFTAETVFMYCPLFSNSLGNVLNCIYIFLADFNQIAFFQIV